MKITNRKLSGIEIKEEVSLEDASVVDFITYLSSLHVAHLKGISKHLATKIEGVLNCINSLPEETHFKEEEFTNQFEVFLRFIESKIEQVKDYFKQTDNLIVTIAEQCSFLSLAGEYYDLKVEIKIRHEEEE